MKRVLIGMVLVISIPMGMSLWDLRKAVRLRTEAVEICARPETKLEGGGYLKGKLAVIDVGEKKWEPLIGSHLPPDLAPTRPEDIGTCVLLEWGAKVEGVYLVERTQGGKQLTHTQEAAMRQNCKITVIDREAGAIVAEQFVFGRAPASGFSNDGSGASPSLGHKPIEEVEDFLFKLPRK